MISIYKNEDDLREFEVNVNGSYGSWRRSLDSSRQLKKF